MRADNVSVVVVLLNSGENLIQSAAPVAAKCLEERRPKDALRRVRLGRSPRRGLRTVLGKICRLRAQRNLGGICVVRSPLGTCNRLSAVRPLSGDGASLRRPVRRRSYQEACSGAADMTELRQLRVVVRRVSVEMRHSYADPPNHSSDTVGGDSCDSETSEADVSRDDDNASEDSITRLSEKDFGEREDDVEEMEPLRGTGSAVAETEDDSWELSPWQSTVDLCSPSVVDQHLTTAVQCVSA